MRCGVNPWVGEIPWRRKWQPTPVFLLRKFHEQRSLAGCSPRGGKVSDTTRWLSSNWSRNWQPTPVLLPGKFHVWRSCKDSDTTERLHFLSIAPFGEGNGRGAWWATVYGVAKSWTRLSSSHTHTHTHPHTHRVQYDLILTLLHLQRPYFQIRSFHKYGGLGLEHIFLVDIAQLTTLGMTWSKSGVRVISEKGNMAGDEKVFWGNNQSFLLTWLWGMKTRWRQFWALCVCKWEKKKTCILLGKCLITLAGAGAEVCKFHERKCHTITGKNKFDSLYWILFFFSNFNLYILLLLLQVKNLYL